MDDQAGGDAQETATVETAATASGSPPATVPMGDEGTTEDSDWHPPVTDENGFARDAHGLPLNLRLRASELADSGADEDPEGSVAPETIAAEVERLADYDASYPKLAANAKTSELEKIAKAEGVDLTTAATNADRVALIQAARPPRV